MKILQIIKNPNGLMNEASVLNGGVEKVAIECHELMLKAGYDSYIVDSDVSSYMNNNVLKLIKKDDNPRTNNQRIANACVDYDIIIVHAHTSIPRYLNDLGKKYLYVDHLGHMSPNKLYFEKLYVDAYEEGKKLGSKFIAVSENSMKVRESMINKWAPDFKFDGWFKFQYITEEISNIKVKPSGGYGVQVARANKEKELNRFAKMDEPYKIVSNGSPQEAENADKVIHNILWNISRNDTIDIMSRGAYMYSTSSVESAGIAAFEALCSGVPLVVHEGKYEHSSRMFAPKDAWYICNQDDKETIAKFKTLTLEERQQISKEVREFNDNEKHFELMMELFKSVENEQTESFIM